MPILTLDKYVLGVVVSVCKEFNLALSSPFKLLAIDVDGTLLFEKEAISQANREALIAAKDHGMVSLCTGRSPGEATWIIDELELNDSFHVLGGGSILRRPGGDVHHLSIMDAELVSEIETKMSQHELAYLSQGNWNFGVKRGIAPFSSIAALASGKEMADVVTAQLQAIAKNHFVTSVAHRDNFWIQVTAPECHKGSGIAELIKHLEISEEEVLVIGDMYNDIPMFEAVPYSVAMGNAPDAVKMKASYVTKEVHRDGLAHAIWEFFFEGKR
jgi:HAD superfamily hydrolase (TIGR01484 family)